MSNYIRANKSNSKAKRKKAFKSFCVVLCVILILVIVASLYFYWRSMMPVVVDIASAKIQAEATRLINQAVCQAVADADFADFTQVERNENGDITVISANSAYVNTLARITAITAQNKIDNLQNYQVDIPVGTLSGVVLLTGKGPNVSVYVTPVGAVDCQFVSVFEQAGVNQTLHRIYAKVNATVSLILPSCSKTTETSTPVLISESLIVGKVPDTYLSGLRLGGYETK